MKYRLCFKIKLIYIFFKIIFFFFFKINYIQYFFFKIDIFIKTNSGYFRLLRECLINPFPLVKPLMKLGMLDRGCSLPLSHPTLAICLDGYSQNKNPCCHHSDIYLYLSYSFFYWLFSFDPFLLLYFYLYFIHLFPQLLNFRKTHFRSNEILFRTKN